MASPAEVVGACLVNAQLVIVPTSQDPPPGPDPVTLFISSMPDDTDLAVAVFDTAGTRFGRSMRDGQSWVHPAVNMLIRHRLYSQGYNLCQQIANFLDSFTSTTVIVTTPASGSEIVAVQSLYRVGTIISLGEEVEKRRQLWSLNLRVAFQGSQQQIG